MYSFIRCSKIGQFRLQKQPIGISEWEEFSKIWQFFWNHSKNAVQCSSLKQAKNVQIEFFCPQQIYPEEKMRSQIIGMILGSMALGVLLGYPFGGILYAFSGKSAPFYIIAAMTFVILGKNILCLLYILVQKLKKLEKITSG